MKIKNVLKTLFRSFKVWFPQKKKKSLLARRIEIGNGARQTKLNFSRITNLVNKSQKHTCISLVAVLLLPEFFIPF